MDFHRLERTAKKMVERRGPPALDVPEAEWRVEEEDVSPREKKGEKWYTGGDDQQALPLQEATPLD